MDGDGVRMDVGGNKTRGLPNSVVNSKDNSDLDFLALGYRGAVHSESLEARSRLGRGGGWKDTGTAAIVSRRLPPCQP